MKNMLLMATTFLAIASPAFGMEPEERKTRTVTIVASLRDETPRIVQASADDDCSPYGRYRSHPGSFHSAPVDYTYDYTSHTISLSIKTRDTSSTEHNFTTQYCPSETGDSLTESLYTHRFKYMIPAGDTDITVQATLLLIEERVPCIYHGRKTATIYEKK